MLTSKKLKMINEVLYKDSEYNLGYRFIEYNLNKFNNNNWSCESDEEMSVLHVQPTFNKWTFKDFDYVKYMVNEFNLDIDFFNYDYENSLTLLVLLHEYGHAHQLRDTIGIEDFEIMVEEYQETERMYRMKLFKLMMNDEMNEQDKQYEMNILYRSKENEYYADSIASQIFNKYGFKLLSIISGKAQKQIRLEMSR